MLAGVDMAQLDQATAWVTAGVGGIVLFGSPPDDLGARLARLRTAGQVTPLIASDEEGGRVQRLTRLLGALPSAETAGRTMAPETIRRLAYGYGVGLRGLGVDLALAPVADLGTPGYYIEQSDRGFSAEPATVAADATAWSSGLRSAHVAASVKHWPGHGEASNSHTGAATTPPLDELERRDLVPFRAALADPAATVVMVGHLTVPGLTEAETPATLSPAALRYLRRDIGPDRLVLTDSMSMAAVTTAMGLTPADAAVRALEAGADLVLVDGGDPAPVIDRIRAALAGGDYQRDLAVASARRVLAVKQVVAAPMVASAPAAATRAGGLMAGYTDPTGAIQVRGWRDGQWGPTGSLGGRTASAPAVVAAPGGTWLLARGTDDVVQVRTTADGRSWTRWQSTRIAAVDAPAATALPDGRVLVAVRAAGDRLVVRARFPDGRWTTDGDLGTTTSAPAVAAAGDELLVAGRTVDGSVVVTSARAGVWQPAVRLDGVTTSAPALAVDPASGAVLLAARGTDGRLHARTRTAAGWQPWQDLGGAPTAAPALTSIGPGEVVALVRGGAYADLHVRAWRDGSWSGDWTRWS